MTVVVVVQSQLRVLVLAGEAPGVRLGAAALLRNDRAERRVVVVGNDLDSRVRAGGRRHDLAHVLVAVMRVEARRRIRAEPRERARRDRFRRIPDEGLAHDRVEGGVGVGFGKKETLRRGRRPRPTIMSRQTGAGEANAG